MPQKEASARIKIDKLLEAAGWRFFDDDLCPANISMVPAKADLVTNNAFWRGNLIVD